MVEDEERPWLHPYCDGGELAQPLIARRTIFQLNI